MTKPNHVVLFCDDVREEKGDKNTYVGVMTNELHIPHSAENIIVPKIVVAIFLTWNVSNPPIGWSLNVEIPHGRGIPFSLPPDGSDKIAPDPYTDSIGIVVHAEFFSVLFKPGDRIIIQLIKGRKKVNIGALGAVHLAKPASTGLPPVSAA